MSNELEINKLLSEKVTLAIRANPGRAIEVMWQRAVDMFSLTPPHEIKEIMWKLTLAPGSDGNFLHRAVFKLILPLYLLAAIGGLVALRKRHRSVLGALLIVEFVLLHAVVSYGSFRFLSPLIPTICLLAGFAISSPIRSQEKIHS